MRVLITGVAGFIGMHVAKRFLENGHKVLGIDNLNNYYDVNLKKNRLKQLNNKNYHFSFFKIDIIKLDHLSIIFEKEEFDIVIHLAAQAGVRYSIENPNAYIDTNINGFLNILELCKVHNIKKLIYASSSSVYGNNSKKEFLEEDDTSHPVSFYGVTKKTNELMAHAYSNLYKFNIIGLRFFTVYGPWGRPDMALFNFTDAILNDKTINVFNYGKMIRDFTFIDDVVDSVEKIVEKMLKKSSKKYDHKVYNVGSENPLTVMNYINELEIVLKKKGKLNFISAQLGDVLRTSSNSGSLYNWINFKPRTKLNHGIKAFVDWYLEQMNRL